MEDKTSLEQLNDDLNELNIKIALSRHFISDEHKQVIQEVKEDIMKTQKKLIKYIEGKFYN